MNGEMSDFEMDVYTRFMAHELLLKQLYVQFANMTENREETLTLQEQALKDVFAALQPESGSAEPWRIKLLQVQKQYGPEMLREFFQSVRTNLPKR